MSRPSQQLLRTYNEFGELVYSEALLKEILEQGFVKKVGSCPAAIEDKDEKEVHKMVRVLKDLFDKKAIEGMYV